MAGVSGSPRASVVLAGSGAFVAALGLLGFGAEVLIALGTGADDSLVRLARGASLLPWRLRSLLWALLVGAACAAFLPPLARGLASRGVDWRPALGVGAAAALVELAARDLLLHDGSLAASSGWRLAAVLAGPLAAGLLAALAAR